MQMDEYIRNNSDVSQYLTVINDVVYKKLLDNCFSVITGNPEVHDTNTLYDSRPDVVKKMYAFLLTTSAEFGKHGSTKEDILLHLKTFGMPSTRANIYLECFEKNRHNLLVTLLNIGNNLPHIIDVKWKMAYIVKSSTIDLASGPLFRVALVVEKFDMKMNNKKIKNINFTCTSQELQDFVYKLRDIVRHCYSLSHGIL